MSKVIIYGDELYHHGIKGMRWGVRRYQNANGTLTEKGKQKLQKQYDRKLNRYNKKASRSKANLDYTNSQIKELEEYGIAHPDLASNLKFLKEQARSGDIQTSSAARFQLNRYGGIATKDDDNVGRSVRRGLLGYTDTEVLKGMYSERMADLKTEKSAIIKKGKEYMKRSEAIMNYPINDVLSGDEGYKAYRKQIKDL